MYGKERAVTKQRRNPERYARLFYCYYSEFLHSIDGIEYEEGHTSQDATMETVKIMRNGKISGYCC